MRFICLLCHNRILSHTLVQAKVSVTPSKLETLQETQSALNT